MSAVCVNKDVLFEYCRLALTILPVLLAAMMGDPVELESQTT